MTDHVRVAITAATTLMLGAYTYVTAVNVVPEGPLDDLVQSGMFGGVVLGLAILGVFAVDRWWALVPAIAPSAVLVYDRAVIDHDAPLRENLYGGFFDHPLQVALGLAVGLRPVGTVKMCRIPSSAQAPRAERKKGEG